jgi:beta-N-acetylhexosaminidase
MILSLAAGCGTNGPLPAYGTAQVRGEVPSARVAHLLDSLPLRARVAQLVMPWIAGSTMSTDSNFARTQRWIDSLQLGGVLVSTGTPANVAAKLNHLQRRSALPLLVSADLEGGSAFRLTGGTAFPTNMGVAAGGREADAYIMGRVTAVEGRAVGIHMTFAPVADVNNNPANPVINTRAFGADPHLVARFVHQAVRGIEDGEMYSTAKHFPGHGDTGTDSHISLPVIAADWTRLDTLELIPFRAAIAAGVTAVMSAHVAMPGVAEDPRRPATLSPDILTGFLRDSLGFQGIVVTDALDMGALQQGTGPGELSVQAFLAGTDLLLQPTDPAAAITAMVAAVESGRISEARLNASVQRVLELKERMGLFEQREVDLARVGAIVAQPDHRQAALEVSRRSVVLVRDDAGLVDSLRSAPRPLTIIAYGEGANSRAGEVLGETLRAAGYTVRLTRVSSPSLTADVAAARRAVSGGTTVIFAISARTISGRGTLGVPAPLATMIEQTARDRPVVLVSLGSPYILSQSPSVSAYLAAWTSNPLTEQAVAEALSGGAISGTLPIPIPPLAPLGAGLQRAER